MNIATIKMKIMVDLVKAGGGGGGGGGFFLGRDFLVGGGFFIGGVPYLIFFARIF